MPIASATSIDAGMSRSGPSPVVAHEAPQATARVELRSVWHRFEATPGWTLQGVDLAIRPGELVGLLGPSGCGKTTLLRLIAGFETPERGEILIDGRPVAASGRFLPPERRGVGMVFQDYALFPHLDAWANTCFGLPPGDARQRPAWLLELLGLGGLERRYPHELSGGQRQRLALARALAPGPAVVLLDEPFSNLDAEVRLRLRSELPEVLERCGTSALLVTHDPEEALAVADRVAVLDQGVLQQVEAPLALVQRPATAFVARFALGALPLPARWCEGRIVTAVGLLEPLPAADAPSSGPPMLEAGEGAGLEVLLRPSDLCFAPAAEAGDAQSGDGVEILGREFLGRDWLYLVQHRSGRLRVRQPLAVDLARGERRKLRLAADAQPMLFPAGLPLRPWADAQQKAP
ncbi:MAG: ABC transporter ATP-binding protein [Cyanobium sp.]